MESNGIGWARAVPPKGDAFGIMRDLWEADKMLDPTDTIMVSHALADGHSKFFKDKRLLENREIAKMEKREKGMRQTNLKIQDGLAGRTT